jgi:hypothetical protein
MAYDDTNGLSGAAVAASNAPVTTQASTLVLRLNPGLRNPQIPGSTLGRSTCLSSLWGRSIVQALAGVEGPCNCMCDGTG